jgi:hypothetical protein
MVSRTAAVCTTGRDGARIDAAVAAEANSSSAGRFAEMMVPGNSSNLLHLFFVRLLGNRDVYIGRGKPGDLEVAALEQERQLLTEEILIPSRELSNPVLGDCKPVRLRAWSRAKLVITASMAG